MPTIDAHAADGHFPVNADRELGTQLTLALFRAEHGATATRYRLANMAAHIHCLPGLP